MGVQVSFNYQAWAAAYPEFSYLTAPQVQEYFNLATMIQRNDGGGPINDSNQQLTLLGLMTAHVIKLLALTSTGQASPDLVGRISSASEGSVSVQTENNYPPGSAQWFQQTKYGAMWWAASSWTRRARYFPGRTRVFEPIFAGNFSRFPFGFGTSWGTLG